MRVGSILQDAAIAVLNTAPVYRTHIRSRKDPVVDCTYASLNLSQLTDRSLAHYHLSVFVHRQKNFDQNGSSYIFTVREINLSLYIRSVVASHVEFRRQVGKAFRVARRLQKRFRSLSKTRTAF